MCIYANLFHIYFFDGGYRVEMLDLGNLLLVKMTMMMMKIIKSSSYNRYACKKYGQIERKERERKIHGFNLQPIQFGKR